MRSPGAPTGAFALCWYPSAHLAYCSHGTVRVGLKWSKFVVLTKVSLTHNGGAGSKQARRRRPTPLLLLLLLLLPPPPPPPPPVRSGRESSESSALSASTAPCHGIFKSVGRGSDPGV